VKVYFLKNFLAYPYFCVVFVLFFKSAMIVYITCEQRILTGGVNPQ